MCVCCPTTQCHTPGVCYLILGDFYLYHLGVYLFHLTCQEGKKKEGRKEGIAMQLSLCLSSDAFYNHFATTNECADGALG